MVSMATTLTADTNRIPHQHTHIYRKPDCVECNALLIALKITMKHSVYSETTFTSVTQEVLVSNTKLQAVYYKRNEVNSIHSNDGWRITEMVG
jgi:hypothetical protein